MNILLLKGKSQYDVLNIFCDELLNAFIALGENADLIDASTVLYSSLDKKYDLIVSFNRVMTSDYYNYINNHNILEWAFMVDHPANHLARLQLDSNNLHLSCVDKTHVYFVNKYLPYVNGCDFVPHGGSMSAIPPKSFSDRQYDIVFFGSYENSMNILKQMSSELSSLSTVVDTILERFTNDFTLSYEKIVEETIIQKNLPTGKDFLLDIFTILSPVENYLRNKKRENIISCLLHNQIHVDVFGNGWEEFPSDNFEFLHIHPSTGYCETLNLLANSKISLNILPLFPEGSHERVFSSMLCKCVCFTDSNEYFSKEEYKDKLCLYSLNSLNELPKQINLILNNEELWTKISEEGFHYASLFHTWKNRAEYILNSAQGLLCKSENSSIMTSDTPKEKITVIIPCYNSSKYIEKCLDSVINQTYGINNLEIICINDASLDNTFEILCNYEKEYPDSFLIINNDNNAKQGYSRNIALKYSTGNYVTFVDSDDFVHESLVEKLYEKIVSSNYDYVYCDYYRVIDNVNYPVSDVLFENDYNTLSEEERKKLITSESGNPGCWGTLYRKSFLFDNDINFSEGIVYEDLVFMGLRNLYVQKYYTIPDKLYYYVDYNNSSIVTQKNSLHHLDRLKAMNEYLDECKKRSFYEKYKNEIDMHFLHIFYINSLTLFAKRFDVVPAEILNQIISTINYLIPDYMSNPYVSTCDGITKSLFGLISQNPTTQKNWDSIMDILRDL